MHEVNMYDDDDDPEAVQHLRSPYVTRMRSQYSKPGYSDRKLQLSWHVVWALQCSRHHAMKMKALLHNIRAKGATGMALLSHTSHCAGELCTDLHV